ncbi:hypothetical protein [Pueribacillus sp. YX66]|uniref:hypothetical protein n=1 Tax=Pueribacillus sp. YX66 TaxID=3229242 RepID=UPI00358D33F7
MQRLLRIVFVALLSVIILASCNDTMDNPETNRKDVEDTNYNEVNEMKMDDEQDEIMIDRVDEDSLNDDGIQGNHPFDLNEDGKLNIQE